MDSVAGSNSIASAQIYHNCYRAGWVSPADNIRNNRTIYLGTIRFASRTRLNAQMWCSAIVWITYNTLIVIALKALVKEGVGTIREKSRVYIYSHHCMVGLNYNRHVVERFPCLNILPCYFIQR